MTRVNTMHSTGQTSSSADRPRHRHSGARQQDWRTRSGFLVVLAIGLCVLPSWAQEEKPPAARATEAKSQLGALRKAFRAAQLKKLSDAPNATPAEVAKRVDDESAWCTGDNPKAAACDVGKISKEERAYLDVLVALTQLATAVDEHVAGRFKPKASIRFGGSADDVPDDDAAKDEDVSRFTGDLSMSFGSYPSEVRLDSSFSVRVSSDVFEEEVTKSRFNFDHYFRDYLEGFAFLERFSDSFMDVTQRYEVGVGADWEFFHSGDRLVRGAWCPALAREADPGTRSEAMRKDLRGLNKGGRKRMAGMVELCAAGIVKPSGAFRRNEQVWEIDKEALKARATAANVPEENGDKLATTAEMLAGLMGETRFVEAVVGRHSAWEVSVAGAVLEESSRYEIETTKIKADATTEEIKASGAESAHRWSVRPSIQWRPLESTTIRLLYMWKPAFGEGEERREDDDRVDAALTVTYTGDPVFGEAKPQAKFEVNYHRNNAPPDATDFATPGPGETIVPAEAGRRHVMTALTFGLQF